MADASGAGAGPGDARKPAEGGPGLGRSGRMSRQREMAAVLRLLRGEGLELASRSPGVTAATLSGRRDAFPAGGEASLATKPADADDLGLVRLKAKPGEELRFLGVASSPAFVRAPEGDGRAERFIRTLKEHLLP